MRINANPVIATGQSLATNYQSSPLNVTQSYLVGVQYTVASASGLTGTLTLLGSIGGLPLTLIPGQTVALSANGSGFLLVPTNYFDTIALNWASTGGTGSLSACMRRKETGS